MIDAPPSGTVTFLFTDIEGSTRLLDAYGEQYVDILGDHRRLLRDAFTRHGGVEVDTQGDAFFVAFARASDAVAAAAEATESLASGPVRVRIGVHTGEPIATEEGYVGIDVHRAARVCAAGHGGQVLLTQTTRNLLTGMAVRDLGEHRLKDLSEPIRLYQLGSEDFPALKTLDATNLPIARSSLLDRQSELKELVSLLSDGSRLVTLTGPGGTGKTRLALQVAAEMVGHIVDGVFWVSLSELSEPDLVVPTVAKTLGAKGVEALRNREAVLLLDNAEHLLEAAPSLGALLAAAPRLRLLVTSRSPLRLSGEREYPLEPLPEADAVKLFVERARAIGREIEPDGVVAAICRRLDGLPLAIELAAARTKILDPNTLLQRLDYVLPLLTGGPRDAPERQRTLRAAIEWSYDLLDEQARTAFRCLAVFVGGFSLEAAEEVSGADLDVLTALVDLSLLKPVGSDRFLMLETIREYALERLEASPDAAELRERHALAFAELAERARIELAGPSRAAWELRLETEIANVRAALAWTVEHRPELFRRLVISMRIFWNTHGYLREGRSWLERALADGAEGLERAEVLGGLGWICRAMGDREGAESAAEERLRLSETLGDVRNMGGALGLQAVLAEERGDLEGAERLHEACIEISRSRGAHGHPERDTGNYAEFLLRQGRYEEASELFAECLAAARERGDTFLVGRYTADVGALTLIDGDPEKALPLLSEGVSVLYRFGERYGTVYCLPLLAESFVALGAAEQGARLLGATGRQLEETGLALWPEGVRRRSVLTAELRNALGDDTYGVLAAEGDALSFDDAVEYALAEAERLGVPIRAREG
jgi:predicted ATPase/class 3 adenylate cyclase